MIGVGFCDCEKFCEICEFCPKFCEICEFFDCVDDNCEDPNDPTSHLPIIISLTTTTGFLAVKSARLVVVDDNVARALRISWWLFKLVVSLEPDGVNCGQNWVVSLDPDGVSCGQN